MSTAPPAQTFHPRVGVAAVIRDEAGKFVFGKRKGIHGGVTGTWQFPGGHLEMGESFINCAERETLEETGLKVKGVKIIATTNDVFDARDKHYITIFVQCRMANPGHQPQLMEPEKCESWHWVEWEDIKRWCESHDNTVTPELAQNKCFLPIRHLVRDYPFDTWGLNWNT
ncbi:NUDIX hydrolase domain-like protein [Hypoxylon sp. FL1284]|nr:NUDIX hydrolase domain-like protein [Hypoxylon sp. FL1284]